MWSWPKKLWHSTAGKVGAALFALMAGLAVYSAYTNNSAPPPVVNTRPYITQMQQQGFLPSHLTQAQWAQAEAQLGLSTSSRSTSVSSTGIKIGLPPALPAPGFGALHIVSQDLTRNALVQVVPTSYGEVFQVHSMTVTVTQSSAAYALDTAFALAGTRGGGGAASVCGATLSAGAHGQPWQVVWPSHVPQYSGGIGRPYPGSAAFLGTLQQDGYIQSSRVDLSNAPAAVWPTNLWAEQPTFGQVLTGEGYPASSAGALVNSLAPGTLYVNLELASKPGEVRWRVSEWNYAFSVNTSMANLALKCNPHTTTPPQHRQTTPPTQTPPSGGGCTGACGGGHCGPPTPWWVCKYHPHRTLQQCYQRADHCVGAILVPTRGPKGQPWPGGS